MSETKEKIKLHWKQYSENKYLGHWDLPNGKDIVVTIQKIVKSEITGSGGVKNFKPLATLKETKLPFIINDTNCKIIEKLTGNPHPEDWIGVKIQLFRTKTKLKKDQVDCIRVRDFIPVVKEKTELNLIMQKVGELIKTYKGENLEEIRENASNARKDKDLEAFKFILSQLQNAKNKAA